MRRLFFLLFLLFGVCVHAATLCAEWRSQAVDTGWFKSKKEATQSAFDAFCAGTNLCVNPQPCSDTDCVYTHRNAGHVTSFNSQLAERQIECGDTCSAQSGKTTTVNWTEGYQRTPSLSDLKSVGAVMKPPANGEACFQGCRVAMVLVAKQYYVSQVPTSQGLYRASADYEADYLGRDCSGTEPLVEPPNVKPTDPEPVCPGALGAVNGQPYCAGTATQPVANDQPLSPSVPPTQGNPAAGEKPTTGEGSGNDGAGRTPSAGTGGPAGGPGAAAGTGTTGPVTGGTVSKPGDGKEQAACGAPGQPKCAIDETGTPTVAGNKFDSAADAYKSTMDTNRGTMSGTSDKGYFNGWTSFWAAPPVASCQTYELPQDKGSIDPCPVVDGVRSVMGYIWALAAMWLCVGMVTRTIRGGE